MLKKAVGLVVFVLILFAGTAGGYYFYKFKSKQVVVDLIAQFSPVAEVTFADLTVDLEGLVQLTDIKISPIGYQDEILIDRLEIATGGALSLIMASSWFKGRLPQNIELQLSSIIFNIDSDFVNLEPRSELLNLDQKTLWGLACKDENDFVSLVEKLGLAQLEVDSTIKLQSDPSGRVFKFAISLSAAGLAKALFEFEISSKVPLDFYDRSVLSQAKITHASLNMTDIGFNLKRTKYCAKQEGVAESAYPDLYRDKVQSKMLGAPAAYLPELEQSILAFFKLRANVVMRINPRYPLYLTEVLNQNFSIFKAQGLTLMVNNKNVSTYYLPLLKGRSIAVLAAVVEEEKMALEFDEIIEMPRPERVVKYRNIDFAELYSLKGQTIRLKTNVGQELDGVLIEVQEEGILMRRRVEHGEVTYPVSRQDIDIIKAFR